MNSFGPLILFLIVFSIFSSINKKKKETTKSKASLKTETPPVRKSSPVKPKNPVSDYSKPSSPVVSLDDESPEGKDPCHELMLQKSDSMEEETVTCSETDNSWSPLSFHRDDIVNGMILGEVLNRKSSAFGSKVSFLPRNRQGM